MFQTDTKYVLNMSGTGHAGMEATIANLVEPGETVVVGNKGLWGMRVADLARRYGANVVEMSTNGEARAFSLDEIKQHLQQHKPALLFLCQGESSMGALLRRRRRVFGAEAVHQGCALCGVHGRAPVRMHRAQQYLAALSMMLTLPSHVRLAHTRTCTFTSRLQPRLRSPAHPPALSTTHPCTRHT